MYLCKYNQAIDSQVEFDSAYSCVDKLNIKSAMNKFSGVKFMGGDGSNRMGTDSTAWITVTRVYVTLRKTFLFMHTLTVYRQTWYTFT